MSGNADREDSCSTKTQGGSATQKEKFPEPTDDPYFGRLVAQGSLRSSDHQRKFLARKSQVPAQFESRTRFQSQPGEYAAVVLSNAFAFLHIWKCGGTTIVDLTGSPQQWSLNEKMIQNRKWLAYVRDPINRFLSAWAECGYRQFHGTISFGGFEEHSTLNWLDDNYDFRVRAFLREVQDFIFPNIWMSCHTHAHPQVRNSPSGSFEPFAM